MHQTTHFFNLGYGWLCKHCSAENTERKHHDAHKCQPLALAKWIDDERRGLMCPRCGIEEQPQRGTKELTQRGTRYPNGHR